jgi:NAD-dependent dihydropyrimidine dehydrogenase PreA subunit
VESGERKQYEWIRVDQDKCISCGDCVEFCPRDVLRLDNQGFPYMAYRDDCWYCDVCTFVCKPKALSLEEVPYLIK